MNLLLPLLFLRLLAAPQESGLFDWFGSYSGRDPAETATLLAGASDRDGFEKEATRFLLANDLLELGLDEGSVSLYEELLESEHFAGAAFVGLARGRIDTGRFDELVLDSRKAPWDRMDEEETSEAAYRVARACFETGRYSAARRWLDEVSGDSPFRPFAAYLRGQVEYVLGRYGHALLAVEPVFEERDPGPVLRALQQRTAILVGDMLTEIGLYERAVQMLQWPSGEGAFARRARLDRIVAHSLAALDRSDFGDAEKLSSIVHEEFDDLTERIDAAVSTEAALDRRARELLDYHQSRRNPPARREWARAKVDEARLAEQGWTAGRVLEVLWRSFPPVIVYELLTRSDEPGPGVPELTRGTRLLLDATGPIRRPLQAVSLFTTAPAGAPEDCAGAARNALATRTATFLLGEAPEPSLDELRATARECTAPETSALEERAWSALRKAILEQAERQRKALRRRRYVLEEAIARARLDREKSLREERMSR